MSDKIAMYPGTFDCLTYGHLDLIKRCSRLFDSVVVVVAKNLKKVPLFTIEERLKMLRLATENFPNVKIDHFSGLTVEYAREHDIQFIIRGLRAVSDFEPELQMALINHRISPEIETIFMAPAINHIFVSSTLTKEILTSGGDVSSLVPPHVEKALLEKLKAKEI